MVGVYMQVNMTEEQYQAVSEKVMSSGVTPAGLKMHTCFGENGHLAIFDVWESKEDFEALGPMLGTLFASEGVDLPVPEFVKMIDYMIA